MKKLTIASVIVASTFANMAQAEIQKDKKLHFTVSTVIGGVTHSLVDDVQVGGITIPDYIVSSSVCMGVGLAKELYDEQSYGGFSKKDLLADAIGCAAGITFSEFAIKPLINSDSAGISISGKF